MRVICGDSSESRLHLFFSKPLRFTLILAMAWISFCAPAAARIYDINGSTMGTTYHIKISTTAPSDPAAVSRAVKDVLAEVNRGMSMFMTDSDISRFNRAEKNVWIPISEGFTSVMNRAVTLFDLTGGAWDGTVKPLVDLWGFGTKDRPDQEPDREAVLSALGHTGFEHIRIEKGRISKTRDGISLDLGSIAKGFGVDQVTRTLKTLGFNHTLVEIGGEVRASGEKEKGRPWRVGIAAPDRRTLHQSVYRALDLVDSALATSGDYRNFIRLGGSTLTHIIDPATGYPVKNGVVSASVLADNCTLADGLATALMVMGPEQGIALVNTMDQAECLIIVQQADGRLVDLFSTGFPR